MAFVLRRPMALTRWRAAAGWLPALLAVGYNLVVLRQQLGAVPSGNDSAVHLAYARWVHAQLLQGHLALDGWYPNLQLGISAARHYQVFPDLITGIVSWPLGVEQTYRWLLYLLLASWPISVYLGGRLLGWRWPASFAALVSPLITSVTGYGYEHSSYIWQGLGLYTQLWAMWLMPLVWGLTWQAVDRGRHLIGASVALGVLICCHFLSGYLAILLLAAWVISVPAGLRRRLLRAGLVAGGGVMLAIWVILPVLLDRAYTLDSQYIQGTFWQDSYGAATVIGWLAGGQLLDAGRWAVLTIAAAVGLATGIGRFRRDARIRALLGALLLSLVLFSGRPTFGAVIGLLPGNEDLLLHRYVIGVQLAGIFLAGIGLAQAAAWLLQAASFFSWPRLRPATPLAIAAAISLLLLPGALQVAQADGRFDTESAQQLAAERAGGVDVKRLVDLAKAQGGRIYAGGNADWGPGFRVGYVPVYIELLNADAEGIGFTFRFPSLMQDAEAHFDSRNLVQYELLDVQYLLMPAELMPPVPGSLVASSGPATLWRVDSGGYVSVVDLIPPTVSATRRDLGSKGAGFLSSADLPQGRFHAVAFEGQPASVSPVAAPGPDGTPAGTVEGVTRSSAGDRFAAEVIANRPAAVLLKIAFDPNWRVTVDGQTKPSLMLLPGMLGVQVPAGRHRLRFTYQPFGGYPVLFLLAVLGAIVIWWLGRRFGSEAVSVAAARQLSGDRRDRPVTRG